MKSEEIILAGGCFWGMEDILRKLHGVLDTEVGYTGGESESPRYTEVKTGRSGHAEAILIRFDSQKLSLATIFDLFFKMHDPTTKDRQGNDIGSQYRSAIFVRDDHQRKEAMAALSRAQSSGLWVRPIVTEVVDAGTFFSAEAEHQDYLEKHPGGYSCHFIR